MKLIVVQATQLAQIKSGNVLIQKMWSADFKVSVTSTYCQRVLLLTIDQKKLSDKLRVCLLAPNLSAYVTGLAEKVLVRAPSAHRLTLMLLQEVMQAVPALFDLPEGVWQDHSAAAYLASKTKKWLTIVRGSLKGKLINSLSTSVSGGARKNPNSLSLNDLAKSMSGPGIEITTDHWARISWLVSNILISLFNFTNKNHHIIALYRPRLHRPSARTEKRRMGTPSRDQNIQE
jgi:hypothetical protein